jgi:hypothetical protein
MEKQETIEKAAETWSNDRVANGDEKNIACYQNGFIDGAKWQSEQMFSREEVVDIIKKLESFPIIYENQLTGKRTTNRNWEFDNTDNWFDIWLQQNLK